jgi:hypothetical protein
MTDKQLKKELMMLLDIKHEGKMYIDTNLFMPPQITKRHFIDLLKFINKHYISRKWVEKELIDSLNKLLHIHKSELEFKLNNGNLYLVNPKYFKSYKLK